MHEGKIYWGDCLDVMQDMAPCSVDLIVTSPPYGNAREQTYGGVAKRLGRKGIGIEKKEDTNIVV